MKIERKKVLTSPQVRIDRGLPWALAGALALGGVRGGYGRPLRRKGRATALLVRWDPDAFSRRGSECDGGVSMRMKGKPKEDERMVKKYVISLMQVVYEDGGEIRITGKEQLWFHEDKKTRNDYDATIQAIREAGFRPYDSVNDLIDKEQKDEKKGY